MEEIRSFLVHLVEIIVLVTLVIELLMFIKKVFSNEKGSRSLLLLLLLATGCVRDIMLTLEVSSKEMNYNVFLTEVVIVFLVFIVINLKEYYYEKEKKE